MHATCKSSNTLHVLISFYVLIYVPRLTHGFIKAEHQLSCGCQLPNSPKLIMLKYDASAVIYNVLQVYRLVAKRG